MISSRRRDDPKVLAIKQTPYERAHSRRAARSPRRKRQAVTAMVEMRRARRGEQPRLGEEGRGRIHASRSYACRHTVRSRWLCAARQRHYADLQHLGTGTTPGQRGSIPIRDHHADPTGLRRSLFNYPTAQATRGGREEWRR